MRPARFTNPVVLAGALVVGLALGSSAFAQEKVYVNFNDPALAGESADPAHQGWVEAFSLDYSRELIVSSGGGGGGGSATLVPGDVTFIKETDRSSPELFGRLANPAQAVFASKVVIEVCREVPTQECYFRLELGSAVVTRIDQAESTCLDPGSCANGTTERVSLTFRRIRWSFIPFSAGKAGTAVSSCWDVASQTEDCPQ